jgi:hypothetical protein
LHPGHLLNLKTYTLSLKHLVQSKTGQPQLKLTVPFLILQKWHILQSSSELFEFFFSNFFFFSFLITKLSSNKQLWIGHFLSFSILCSLHNPQPQVEKEKIDFSHKIQWLLLLLLLLLFPLNLEEITFFLFY